MTESEKLHNKRVQKISAQLKKFYKQKKKVRIYHGSTNSTRTQEFKKDEIVYITDLNNVIEVNPKEKYAVVESNVPMDKLVEETFKFGLIPPVVMEFPGITVGGGIQGGAGESSSFKWGLFHHICLEYEMVLGDGKIITASSKKTSDLYWGTACSYGSLGIITQVKLRLISAKKFIHLTYHKVNSFKESIKSIEEASRDSVDFIDGILFSKQTGVIMSGKFSDKKDAPVVTFRKAIDDWFYVHAEKIIKKHKKWKEIIPLKDYLFRYDRGAFWAGNYAFKRSRIPFNRFTRFILNPLFKTRTLYRFLQAINISQRQIVQDFCLPRESVLPFLELVDKMTNIYPIWICPGWVAKKYDKLSPGYLSNNFIIDIGVWGKTQGDFEHLVKLNRDLEKTLTEYKGRKVLYAHSYYPKDEFWKIYDFKWYEKLRKKYKAEKVFPDVYEKTKVSKKYNVSITKGLLNVIKSPFKLPIN
ncbi:MAG: FAD-binding oxidoreductase [Candidatus Levybacteria bacterium]|nr:FAD-binding oxidoreductase [Candidatus Levybacteria bacterium]